MQTNAITDTVSGLIIFITRSQWFLHCPLTSCGSVVPELAPLSGTRHGIASNELTQRGQRLGQPMSFCILRSRIEPHRHAGLEAGRITPQIEAQAQRIAVVIANRTLGLPGRESAERTQFGDQGWRLIRRA